VREWARQFYTAWRAHRARTTQQRRGRTTAAGGHRHLTGTQQTTSPSLMTERRLAVSSSGQVRVFQVASGNLGTEMISRIREHRDLDVVGLHCYSPEKIGWDAGEIVGIELVDFVTNRPPETAGRPHSHVHNAPPRAL
jgi:hypothetical protein